MRKIPNENSRTRNSNTKAVRKGRGMSRPIRFRAWDKERRKMLTSGNLMLDSLGNLFWQFGHDFPEQLIRDQYDLMQYTGLLDKTGIDYIYEGDIIGSDGLKKGNKYETPNLLEEKANFLIEGMGTKSWRNTEQKAMERGCFYPK